MGIYVADATGAGANRLLETRSTSIISTLSWSPDGSRLAFTTSSSMVMTPEPHSLNDGQICVVRVANASVACLTDKSDNGSPAWQPGP